MRFGASASTSSWTASRGAVRDDLEPDLTESAARYWSRFGEGRYAEAFEGMRDGAAVATGRAP